MRICFLADGKSIHTQRWCSHFRDRGHDIHLITFRDTGIEGVHVHYIPAGNVSSSGGNYKILLKFPAVRRIIRSIAPDILHAMYATSYGWMGRMSGFHPFVLTALGSDVLISPFQSRLYKLLVRQVISHADWITAMSDPMKKVLLELGAPADRTEVVIFGVDPMVFNASQRSIPGDIFRITSTRNMEPVYNIDVIIDAVRLLGNKIPTLRVDLIGDGSQRSTLEEKCKTEGIRNISFHGRLTQQAIAEHLNATQVFISSALSDGNNISLNEAMACGCYCIATDIPPNRVWIEHGKNGSLFRPGDANELSELILYVYQHYQRLHAASFTGNISLIRNKADWNENMRKVEQQYHKLCDK